MTLRQAQGDRDVLVTREGAAAFLSLNRPAALHALTLDMCHEMSAANQTRLRATINAFENAA